MRSHSKYLGLDLPTQLKVILKEASHTCRELKTIHHWHIKISDDELVLETLAVGEAHRIQCLSSINTEVNLVLNVEAKYLKKELD